MIKDFLISFKENIKEKTTNPFLGAFLIVWTVNHWKFIYSLFTFDSITTLEQRVKIIELYFASETIWTYLINPILQTLFVITGSYALVNISRLIVNFFEKRVTPLVYKISDSNSIVLKQDYLKLKKEIEDLNIKLERERESKVKAQAERDGYEEKLNSQLAKSLRDSSSAHTQDKEPQIEDTKAKKIAKKIKDEGHEYDWTNVIMESEKDNYIKYNTSTDLFLQLGLVKLIESYQKEGKFRLTPLGKGVRDALNDSQL